MARKAAKLSVGSLATLTDPLELELVRRPLRLILMHQHEDGEPLSPDEQAWAKGQDYAACASDVLYWIRNYGLITNPKSPDPESRKLPLILWPRQVELVERALHAKANQETLVVNKAREIGASWLMLHLVAHAWMFEPGFSAHLGSRKEELVDNRTLDSLFGKLRWVIEHQPAHLLSRDDYDDTNARLIHRRNGSEVTGESTNEGWGRSARKTVLFLDEFAHVEPALQDRIWTGIESVSGCKWVVSTPNGKGNKFHFLSLMLPEEKRITLDWQTDPRRDYAWFEARLLENGGDLSWDEREQEHACSFAGVSGHRILKFDRAKAEFGDEDLPIRARETFMVAGAMDFGSGPSFTVLLLGIIDWGDPPEAPPNVWIDRELYWERKPSWEVAKDGRAALMEYGGKRVVVGDPAGKAKEHDQESWESSLQGAGLPVYCLPSQFNDHYTIGKTIQELGQGLERGWVRIHRERCKVLLEACEQWEWDLPRGIPLELVNRAEIKPKKDHWSHFGDAARYLVGFVLRSLQPKTVVTGPHPEVAPKAKVATIAGELKRMVEEEGIGVGGGWPTV